MLSSCVCSHPWPLSWPRQSVRRSEENASHWLSGDQAIDVNIAIMRAFVRLRELLCTHKDLARKLAELEKNYDAQRLLVEVMRDG